MRSGSGSDADPEVLSAFDGNTSPGPSTGLGNPDTKGHHNVYAEASQAREIGRKPHHFDLSHRAEVGSTIGNNVSEDADLTSDSAVSERPDRVTNDADNLIESIPPASEDSLKQTPAAITPRMLRVEEVAAYLGMSVSKVWRLPSKDPDFPLPIRIGGSTRWDWSEIDRFVEFHKSRRRTHR